MTMRFPKSMLADLKRGGLTVKDAKRMHLEYLDRDQTITVLRTPTWSKNSKVWFEKVPPSYRIPYFDLDGKVNGFERLRLLGKFIPPGDKKPRKYHQATGVESRMFYKWSGSMRALVFYERRKPSAKEPIREFRRVQEILLGEVACRGNVH